MTKEQMDKYAYELMIKNNPEEAVKNLLLKDKQLTNLQEGNHNLLQEIEDMQNKNNKLIERNEKAIEYIKDRLEEGCLDKLNYYDLHKIESILQGEDKDE